MSSKERPLALVTGAGKGVGRATAIELARSFGYEVLALSRNADDLRSLQAELGAEAVLTPLALDLGAEDMAGRLTAELAGRPLQVVVNNAGLLIKRALGEWTSADMHALFRTNVFAPVALVQAVLPSLRAAPWAHVVNIGSMGGYQGSVKFPGLLMYSASKAALANATECLAEELKGSAVRVNCLCLGSVDTAMLRAAFPDFRAPVSSLAMGSYVARFAVEGHKFFNGKVLPVAATTP